MDLGVPSKNMGLGIFIFAFFILFIEMRMLLNILSRVLSAEF